MKPALIDTNILSFFFRNHSLVVEGFQAYLKEHDKINISIITYYEIVSGLKHRDAQKQLISLSSELLAAALRYRTMVFIGLH